MDEPYPYTTLVRSAAPGDERPAAGGPTQPRAAAGADDRCRMGLEPRWVVALSTLRAAALSAAGRRRSAAPADGRLILPRYSSLQASSKSSRAARGRSEPVSPWPRLLRTLERQLAPPTEAASTRPRSNPYIAPQSRHPRRAATTK